MGTDPTWDAVRADLIATLAGLAWRKRRCDGLLADFRRRLRRSPSRHAEIATQARWVVAEQAEAIARSVEIECFLRQMKPFTNGPDVPPGLSDATRTGAGTVHLGLGNE